MLALFLIVCAVAFMGFILAWITGVVAHEEITVGRGMLIVFLTWLATILVAMSLYGAFQLPEPLLGLINLGVWLLVMSLLLTQSASIKKSQALIISSAYSGVYFAISLAIHFALS